MVVFNILIKWISFSFLFSFALLVFFILQDLIINLFRIYISNKYKKDIRLKERYVWDMYNDKKLRKVLTEKERRVCATLKNRLNIFKTDLEKNNCSKTQKKIITKSIQRQVLNLKTFEDVYNAKNRVEFILESNNINSFYQNKNKLDKDKNKNKENNNIIFIKEYFKQVEQK